VHISEVRVGQDVPQSDYDKRYSTAGTAPTISAVLSRRQNKPPMKAINAKAPLIEPMAC